MNTMVKERGILMTAPNVLNIQADLKLQTRRIMKPQPVYRENEAVPGSYGTFFHGWNLDHWASKPSDYWQHCPQGRPGDLLWLREAWRTGEKLDKYSGSKIAELSNAAGYDGDRPKCSLKYEADGYHRQWCEDDIKEFGEWGRYRHARFICRWAARIFLEITGIRVERLNDISEQDAIAEGIRVHDPGHGNAGCRYSAPGMAVMFLTAKAAFRALWESINGPDSWDLNPWVWVIEFRRIES